MRYMLAQWLLEIVCLLTGGHEYVVSDSDIYYDELTCARCGKMRTRPCDEWSTW